MGGRRHPLHVVLITCWDSTQCIQLGHFIKIILSDRATGLGARETALQEKLTSCRDHHLINGR